MYIFALLVLCLGVSEGFLFRKPSGKWNDLRVKWGLGVWSSDLFARQPRTVSAATNAGFSMLSDCGVAANFAGRRYAKNGDKSLILLYDQQGYIAGIQAGFAMWQANGYPPSRQVNAPFVLYEDYYYVTAYFVDPSTICNPGRSGDQFTEQGTGTGLYIQNGTTPDTVLNIPMNQIDMSDTMWTRGKCFYSMGDHYWYNVTKDMSCDNFFPVFLLYNDGRLNGFGWALNTHLLSPNWEHPPHWAVGAFVNPVPDCLAHQGTLSTMHIYMTDSPRSNWC